MQSDRIGCLILAAGSSIRFGSNKLLAELGGKPVIQLVLDAIPAARFDHVVVVTRYPQIMAMAQAAGFGAIRNDAPELGISHSLQLGLRQLAHCSGVLCLVADQPLLQRKSIEALLDRWQQEPAAIVCAACGGKRRNPCLFPRDLFPQLLAVTGDRGGSQIIARHRQRLRLVELPEAELLDCDTPEQLLQLRSSQAHSF